MNMFKTALVALSLVAVPATVFGQAAAPAAAPAPVAAPAPALDVAKSAPAPVDAAPVAATPAPAAATTAPAKSAPKVAPPAAQMPRADIGQPVLGKIGIQPQVTALGEQGLWIHNAILMPIIVVITLFVLGLLIWVMAFYRRSANPVPSKTTHNTFIEIVWTLVPVLILVGIAIPSISLLAAQFKPAGKDAVTIKVIGHQWYWSYEYPDHGGIEIVANMLKESTGPGAAAKGERVRTAADGPRLLAVDNRVVLPVDTEIRAIVTSDDVIHSFAMPAFWTKMDAVPGRLNEVTFKVEKGKEGVYFGQCSELCGARHGYMPIVIEIVSKDNFAQWIASQGGSMPGAAAAPAAASAPSAAPAAKPAA